jgi:transposase
MDNRNLSPNELRVLRIKAVESVVSHGLTQTKASEIFGFSRTSMCKYIKEYKSKQDESFRYEKRGLKVGMRRKMEITQEEELIRDILTNTPDQLGLNYTLWNSKVVQEYISLKYSLSYNRRSIRKIMTRLGFSSQKPIKLAYQRDPKKIEAWLSDIYPKIKLRTMQEGARIYWGDEMGVQSIDNRGRTYGLKGEKPIIKKTGSRFKCNMLAAISPQGFMHWMVFKDNFTSEKFISFLGRLVRQIKQKVFLIVDNHKVHHSKKVKTYVGKHKDKLEVFYLPPYCPDMNPEELVNQDVKANFGNFKAVKSMNDLAINLRHYLTKLQFNQFKIRKFFTKKETSYSAW